MHKKYCKLKLVCQEKEKSISTDRRWILKRNGSLDDSVGRNEEKNSLFL